MGRADTLIALSTDRQESVRQDLTAVGKGRSGDGA